MQTKREIIEKNGFDFDLFELQNEYDAKNLLLAMDEHAQQTLQAFVEWHNANYIDTGAYIPNSRIGMFNQQMKGKK
jgi:hypothetical protein